MNVLRAFIPYCDTDEFGQQLIPRVEEPRRKTATVMAMNAEPRKLGNLAQIRPVVLLYFSIHVVTAMGSTGRSIAVLFVAGHDQDLK